MLGEKYHKDIDALKVENEITPFSINDEKETIENLLAANGNQPLISQLQSIQILGWSDDAAQTLRDIQEQSRLDEFELTGSSPDETTATPAPK
jgi:hypothetical protein